MTDIATALFGRSVVLICGDRVSDDEEMPGLSEVGIRASARRVYVGLRDKLGDLGGDRRLVVGDVRRCQQTAARLLPDQEWQVEPHFAPRDMGLWTGSRWDEIRESDPVRCDAFWTEYARAKPPQGESMRDVRDRVNGALIGLTNQTDWDRCVVVMPPEVIQAVLCIVLDVNIQNALKFGVRPLHLTTLSHGWTGWRLESMNTPPT